MIISVEVEDSESKDDMMDDDRQLIGRAPQTINIYKHTVIYRQKTQDENCFRALTPNSWLILSLPTPLGLNTNSDSGEVSEEQELKLDLRTLAQC